MARAGIAHGRIIRMDDLITAAEAATLLHLHVKRVQHLARAGQLPATRFGHKWLFSRSKLLATRKPVAGHDELMGALEISARNRLRGRISSIVADGVMAEVRIQVADQEIVSIITRSSAERLRLDVGDEVFAVVKSTEVMIAKAG
jgi:molybdopterin-binding protein